MLGAFAPLPLRLSTSTLTAPQFQRLANDVAEAKRSSPLAVISLSEIASELRTVTWYAGRNGSGLAHAPTVSAYGDASGVYLTWPATYEDEAGDSHRWNIVQARAKGNYYDSKVYFGSGVVTAPNQIAVWSDDYYNAGGGGPLTVTIWGLDTISIEDYGGSTDKANCETERTPYAAQYYRMLQDGLGDGFSKELSGLTHAQNLCTARALGWSQRLTEKNGCEKVPSTADQRLEDWCSALGVDQRDNSPEMKRRRATAAYTVLSGASIPRVEAAVSQLLGKWYVKCWRNWNDSMTPADITFWPGVNPGPSQWDIGGGCWLSEHAHLVIEVVEPSDGDRAEFLELVNVDLHRLLDRILPAHMTWNWCTNYEDGFRLDYGTLDYEGLGAA